MDAQKKRKLEKEAAEKLIRRQAGMMNNEPAIGTYTFDSYGKMIQIKQVKIDKLSPIITQQPGIRERKPPLDDKRKKMIHQ